jgi:hypothetical protein
MFLKKFLLVVLICAAGNGLLNAQTANLCTSEQSCSDPNNPCKCYCSVKCGERDKEDKDNPRIEALPGDPMGKRCFCADRDVALFEENKCVEEDEKHTEPTPAA